MDRTQRATSDASSKFNQQVESNYEHGRAPAQAGGFSLPSSRSSEFGRKPILAPSPEATAKTQGVQWTQPSLADQQASAQLSPAEYETRTGVTQNAVNNGPAGSKDLESMLGTSAWSKLIGDTMKAQGEAHALGSETGVQGLLQKQAAQPTAQNGAFDAALINGQGAKGFQGLSRQYGGDALSKGLIDANAGAQGAWSSLVGDVGEAKREQTATAEADAANKATRDAANAAQQRQLQDQLDYLKQHFPLPNGWDDPQNGQNNFLDWFEQNRFGGGTGASNIPAWEDQIYGSHDNKTLDQFYADLRRMTPAEYQAFCYGVVPAWMGKGAKASGANGGGFWGLGATGNKTTATTTNTPTAENQQEWNDKQQALKTYYQVLEAIAAAG